MRVQGASQEALLAHQRGDFGVAARLLCQSAPAGASGAELARALNNLGCIQACARACSLSIVGEVLFRPSKSV